jgi:hypothetical protein
MKVAGMRCGMRGAFSEDGYDTRRFPADSVPPSPQPPTCTSKRIG